MAKKTTTAKKATKKAAKKIGSKKAAASAAIKKTAGKGAKIAAKKASKRAAKKAPKKAPKKSISNVSSKNLRGAELGSKSAAKSPIKSLTVSALVTPAAGTRRQPPSVRQQTTRPAARKTARSRLAERHEPVRPSRKTASRTSIASGPAGLRKRGKATAAIADAFHPADVRFRQAERQDWPGIRRLLIDAFGRENESDLVERLRASRNIAGEYIAVLAGRPAAYVAFTGLSVSLDQKPLRAVGLAPLAVASELEGKGLGLRIMRFGLESMRGLGYSAIFVLGDPAYYGRMGFSEKIAARFRSPGPGGHYLALEFEPGALRGEHGQSDWPEAFSAL